MNVKISKVTFKKVEYTELHVDEFIGRICKQERRWSVTVPRSVVGGHAPSTGRFRKLGDFGTRMAALAKLFEVVVGAHANCEIPVQITKTRPKNIEHIELHVDGEFIGQTRNWGRAKWEACVPRTLRVQFGGALRPIDVFPTLDDALAGLLAQHLDASTYPEKDPHALKVPEAAAEFAEAVEQVVRQCDEGELSDEDCLDQLHSLLHEHNTPLCDALRKLRGTYVEVEVITKPLQCPDCDEIHIGDELEEFWARGGVGDCPKKGVPKLAWITTVRILGVDSGTHSATYRDHQVAIEKVLGSEYVSLGDHVRGVTWIFRLDGRVVESSARPDEWAPCHEHNLTEAKKVAAAVFNAVLDPERADFRLAAAVTNQADAGLGKVGATP